MRRPLILAALALACGDKDDADSGTNTTAACGTMSAFVSGTVTGPGATEATVLANGPSEVTADWTAPDGETLRYELNLPTAGEWSINAYVGDCEGEPFELSVAACTEHTVDLSVSCL